jgi:hypothetical protein
VLQNPPLRQAAKRYTHPTLGIIGNEKYKSMPKIIIPNAITMYLIS